MDIKAEAEKLIKKITGDKNLLANFKKNPIETIKGLLGGVDVQADDVSKIADLVKAKIGADDAAKKASGIGAKLKGLFKK